CSRSGSIAYVTRVRCCNVATTSSPRGLGLGTMACSKVSGCTEKLRHLVPHIYPAGEPVATVATGSYLPQRPTLAREFPCRRPGNRLSRLFTHIPVSAVAREPEAGVGGTSWSETA